LIVKLDLRRDSLSMMSWSEPDFNMEELRGAVSLRSTEASSDDGGLSDSDPDPSSDDDGCSSEDEQDCSSTRKNTPWDGIDVERLLAYT
jgi:hypothetical protein